MDQNDTMKATGNILVFTQWSYKDALVQTYTLPYVDIIRKIISPERKILLLTAEQNPIALNEHETEAINADWAKKEHEAIASAVQAIWIQKNDRFGRKSFQIIQDHKKRKNKNDPRCVHASRWPCLYSQCFNRGKICS